MNPAWTPVLVATPAWLGALAAALMCHGGAGMIRPLVRLSQLFFAAVAIFDLLPASQRALTWPIFIASVGVGYGGFWLIGRYLAPMCPACAMQHVEESHHRADGRGLVFLTVVLVAHCFCDGLGVGAASTSQARMNLHMLAAMALHKFPEGFALGLLLMTGTRSPLVACGIAAGIETSTLVGAITGAFWMDPSAFWRSIVLAYVGGTFLYLSGSSLQEALAPRGAPEVAVAEGVRINRERTTNRQNAISLPAHGATQPLPRT